MDLGRNIEDKANWRKFRVHRGDKSNFVERWTSGHLPRLGSYNIEAGIEFW
jgi:hypothetical protein